MFDPYPNLPHQIRNYALNSIISHGGFAIVYKATHLFFKMDFAIKVVCRSTISEKNAMTYEAEVNSLTKLDHPNVIRLYDFFVEDDNMFLVLEYCSGGTLEERISNKRDMPNEEKISICSQIVSALKYCYDMSIAHQDIKTSNVLFDENGRIKVADFGLSGFIKDNANINTHKGTLNYLAPEICQKRSFNPFKSDIWSLGVLFYRLFTGSYPFFGQTKEELKKKIIDGFYPEILKGPILKPVRQMLITDPNERISIEKLSKMPLFNVPMSSSTLSAFPRLREKSSNNLNIKLSKRKSSLLYHQKISLQGSKTRQYSFSQTITPLTFSEKSS